MKNFLKYRALLASISTVLFVLNSVGQETKINVIQDQKFQKLLNEKRRVNAGNVADDNFKIQIFNGTAEDAKKSLISFRKDFFDFESTIVFSTPNYKVIAGNFKTRIEAERNLVEIRKIYKNALLLRPKK